MRRSDKKISSRAEIDIILHNCPVLHLAMTQNDQPYLVPLSFGYDGNALYFHSADKGKKLDILRENPRVCFQVEQNIELVKDAEKACDWSFRYESVIGFGQAVEITTAAQRREALNQIMLHYSGRDWDFPESTLSRTSVWQIPIDEISGKRSSEKL